MNTTILMRKCRGKIYEDPRVYWGFVPQFLALSNLAFQTAAVRPPSTDTPSPSPTDQTAGPPNNSRSRRQMDRRSSSAADTGCTGPATIDRGCFHSAPCCPSPSIAGSVPWSRRFAAPPQRHAFAVPADPWPGAGYCSHPGNGSATGKRRHSKSPLVSRKCACGSGQVFPHIRRGPRPVLWDRLGRGP